MISFFMGCFIFKQWFLMSGIVIVKPNCSVHNSSVKKLPKSNWVHDVKHFVQQRLILIFNEIEQTSGLAVGTSLHNLVRADIITTNIRCKNIAKPQLPSALWTTNQRCNLWDLTTTSTEDLYNNYMIMIIFIFMSWNIESDPPIPFSA